MSQGGNSPCQLQISRYISRVKSVISTEMSKRCQAVHVKASNVIALDSLFILRKLALH